MDKPAKPIAGQPFVIPEDWVIFPCDGCPNCYAVHLMAETFLEDEDRPEDMELWFKDGTACVCDNCGFIGTISADGDAWLQESSDPLEFVILVKPSTEPSHG
jgi:hypothetical protein